MRARVLGLLAVLIAGVLGPGSPAKAHPVLHVVGLGDSVMAGTGCGCEGIVEEYAAGLRARTGVAVTGTNLGVPGDTSTDLVGHLSHDDVVRRAVADADVVVITVGANDVAAQGDRWRGSRCDDECWRPSVVATAGWLATALAQVGTLREGRPTTVLVTDYWNVLPDGDVARSTVGAQALRWSENLTAAVNGGICAAAGAVDATCVRLVPPFKEGRDPTDLLAADGDHPNAAGVRVIVGQLLAATPPFPRTPRSRSTSAVYRRVRTRALCST